MSERLNKVHLIISTIAATVVAIGFIVIHVYFETHGLLLMAMWVSISIVLFYFIGHIVRAFLVTKVFPEEEGGESAEDSADEALADSASEEIVVAADADVPELAMSLPLDAEAEDFEFFDKAHD